MAKKVGIISLGCAKNLVDSEQMLSLLDDAGFELVSDLEGADAVVINTCGFIEFAREEAYENIREAGLLKEEGKLGKIIVAGCLPQRVGEELFENFPEIDALVGCGSFMEIVDAVKRTLSGESVSLFGDIDAEIREEGRILTTPVHMAYIKIAEGCDNKCSYCVIPALRGKFRSRRMEDIISEAEGLAESGVKELIVVAQDTTRYGIDLYGERKISELLKELCKIEGLSWIRLHYLYPDEIDDNLIETVANEEKIVKYLDIPIQHVNDRILNAMNRRGNAEYLDKLFTKLRERIPGLVLRTSLIVGLPGETDDEFEELCDFIAKHRIERAGAFAFSPQEGTPAYDMPDQISESIKERRVELICSLTDRIMNEWNESKIGKVEKVLCEGFDQYAECFFGRSYADSPDIDGKIFFDAPKNTAIGEIYDVELTEVLDGDLVGKIVK